jgi:hypothetical protein
MGYFDFYKYLFRENEISWDSFKQKKNAFEICEYYSSNCAFPVSCK